MPTIQVRIYDTPDGPYVDREPVHLKPNKEIEWVHANGDNFTVTFNGPGPFRNLSFNESNPKSGNPTVGSDATKVYKYSVTSQGVTIDPGVIVH